MAKGPNHRRLVVPTSAAFAEDGTGVVHTRTGTRPGSYPTQFRLTRAFPRGADYDKAGNAYSRDIPRKKAQDPAREFVEDPAELMA